MGGGMADAFTLSADQRERPVAGVAGALGWAALAIVLAGAVLRATVPMVDVPGWGTSPLLVLDPLLPRLPDVGLGPAAGLACDAAMVVGAGLLLVVHGGGRGAGRRVALPALLALAGAAVAVYHGWLAGGGGGGPGSGDQRLGAAWVSAVVAATGLMAACADPARRRVAAAVLVGVLGLLLLKAASQAIIENPQAVADYRASREAIHASRGWTPDSAAALAYDRRVMNPDLTGWLALGNVFSTLLAACGVALGVLTWAAGRAGATRADPDTLARWAPLLMGGAAVLGALAVVWDGSKGAIGAMLLGVAAAWAVARPGGGAWRVWLPPALMAAALLAVAVRGLVGERVGELSLWFRAMYLEAASRIFAAHPAGGVGPGGFKDAYLLHRNPLSPEEVASPHSVMADWLACLGIAGAAWCVLLVVMARRSARAAPATGTEADGAGPRPIDPVDPGSARFELRLVAAVVVGCTVLACVVERPAMTPEAAAVRVLGMLAWLGLGAAWVLVSRRGGGVDRLALAGAAVTLLVHAQIEMSMTWPQSAGLAMALVAVAAGGGPVRPRAAGAGRPWGAVAARAMGAVTVGAGLLAVPLAVLPTAGWAAAVDRAAATAHPSGRAEAIVRALSSPATPAPARAELAGVLAELLRQEGVLAPGERPAQVTPAQLAAFDARVLRRAAEALHAAAGEASPLQMEAASLMQRVAQAERALGMTDRAVGALTMARAWLIGAQRREAAALGQRAGLERQLHAITGQPVWLEHAAETLERSLARDPFGLPSAVALARVLNERAATGDPDGRWATRARAAARRALEIDRWKRLDAAVAGLSGADRQLLERMVGSSASTPGG